MALTQLSAVVRNVEAGDDLLSPVAAASLWQSGVHAIGDGGTFPTCFFFREVILSQAHQTADNKLFREAASPRIEHCFLDLFMELTDKVSLSLCWPCHCIRPFASSEISRTRTMNASSA